MSTTEELVVLLDDHGRPSGTMPKSRVHHAATPLHLAFSCWLSDETGQILLTQRAAAKLTWPLAWTNAFCGHPGPGEDMLDAVRRRARAELGVHVTELQVELPDFRYTARMTNGVTENEVCPVYRARIEPSALRPDPAEVADCRWTTMEQLRSDVAAKPELFSPWLRQQLTLLA